MGGWKIGRLDEETLSADGRDIRRRGPGGGSCCQPELTLLLGAVARNHFSSRTEAFLAHSHGASPVTRAVTHTRQRLMLDIRLGVYSSPPFPLVPYPLLSARHPPPPPPVPFLFIVLLFSPHPVQPGICCTLIVRNVLATRIHNSLTMAPGWAAYRHLAYFSLTFFTCICTLTALSVIFASSRSLSRCNGDRAS